MTPLSSYSFLRPDYIGFLGLDEDLIQISNQIESSGSFDQYRFDLVRGQRLTLEVTNDRPLLVSLLDRDGTVIATAESLSATQQILTADLQPGAYSIRLLAPSASSTYAFSLLTQTVSPTVSVNETLTLPAGTTVTVTPANLQATNDQRPSETVVYKVTDLPEFGRLELNNRRLREDSFFTQADVNQGRLTYISNGKLTELDEGREEYAGNISGSNYVWSSLEIGIDGDFEIFAYNEDTQETIQITNNETDDILPRIDGSNIVWSGFDGNDYEVFLFLSATGEIRQLTNNTLDDFAQDIDGVNVIWNSFLTENQLEAFSYDIRTGLAQELLVPVQNGGFQSNVAIRISNNQVLGHGFDGTDFEVFLFDTQTKTNRLLTDNDFFNDFGVDISNNSVIWNGFDGNDFEVFLYDGISNTAQQLTDNDLEDQAVDIDENLIVSNQFDGQDNEIVLHKLFTDEMVFLTDNTTEDLAVGVAGSTVVWNTRSLTSSGLSFSPVVMHYDASRGITTQIANSNNKAVSVAENRIFINNIDLFDPARSRSLGVTIAEIPQPGFRDNFEFSVTDGLNTFGQDGSFNIQLI